MKSQEITSDQITILIVDDEKHMCRTLEILLSQEYGFKVKTALGYYEALQLLDTTIDLVLADLTMPDKDGLSLLRQIKKIQPTTDVIMMTAHSTVESAIQALKEGAVEYLIKPFASEKLIELIERTLRKRRNYKRSSNIQNGQQHFSDMIGASKVMQQIYGLVQKAAEVDSNILISGESGTGKELVARAIHFNGIRRRYPFVTIGCSGIPEMMLDSEIFGKDHQQSKFDDAKHGTLFLDEIGDLSLALQEKLLRLLQTQAHEKNSAISSNQQLDVRCIAATNKNLLIAMQQSSFREDLFYRLNVFHIFVPPLRERREDIPLLADYFLHKKSQQLNIPIKPLTQAAEQLLLDYHYPGNVRELENLLERALVVASHRSIRPQDLSLAMNQAFSPTGNNMLHQLGLHNLALEQGWGKIDAITKELQRELLSRALILYKGASNDELARLLGTTRRVLELRLREFGLSKY